MSLNETEIGLVAKCLDDALQGAVVRKIFSPAAPDRIAVEFRSPGKNHLLQIVISTGFCRLGRIESKPPVAQVPVPFVMLLRNKAVGLTVRAVEQLGDDRAVAIRLRGQKGDGTLICELTSRHANLFWVDSDDTISGSFHPNRSAKRLLVPGEPYRPLIPRQVQHTASRFEEDPKNLESLIEEHYRHQESRQRSEASKEQVLKRLRRKAKKIGRLVSNLEGDLEKSRQGDALQQKAYVLQTHFYKVKKGEASVTLQDFEGNPVTIELDPRLDPSGNLNALFEKAKRLRGSVSRITQRLEAKRVEHNEFASFIETIVNAAPEDLPGLISKARELVPDQLTSGKGKAQQVTRSPFKEFAISFGRTAKVGRSAADNDALTLRNSRPDDLWLHARGLPGSHVVVPMGRGEDPSQDLLIDAAHLAAHFSDARGDSDVEITYTRRRYVQKPRGFPPGAVRLLKEKTVLLKVDEERMARLLGRDQ